jgi:D-alanyl-D-alanine carboxypeptidase/D-alanyl-D-alanine-endopeptidase (penicillin-binding protein 4)
VLRPAGAAPQAAGGAGTLTARLDRIMAGPDLGPVRTGAVIDVTTGQVLYAHRATTAGTPASLTKIATAVAALGTLGPAHRLTTTVVTTAPGRIVLVGGGDPTLELGGLADDTAAALRARGLRSVRLAYDTSYFAGPALHPIGYNENLAPVTALMVREGRLDGSSSGPAPRTTDPAGAAAASFAQLLRARGIEVTGKPAAGSGAGGTRLAVHQSPALSDLVERMLTNSDNDIAEALARQVARASGQRPDLAGGARAVRAALGRYGVPLGGAVFADGSGLDHADALAPLTLVRLLALAGDAGHPELRPVLTGLPVAAFTGTLASRFQGTAGAGLIRAKTGTLTGTNTIAGTTVLADGRMLAFSFMTQGAPAPLPAEAALDHLAAALLAP